MVVDTGSCHTIVRPDIVKHCRISDTGTKFILETAAGESMPVLGIHEAEVKLGRHVFNHTVFVANITDDVLMGLDLMEQHKFQLDLENRLIKTGQDEIVMMTPEQDMRVRKVTLQEDVNLPARSETIVKVNLDRKTELSKLQLIEPSYEEEDDAVKKGVLVARTLVQQKNGQAYVKVANLKECGQRLKKGDIIAKSEPVLMVTKESHETKPNPDSDLPECLVHLMKKTSSILTDQEKQTFGRLLHDYKDVFALNETDLGRTHLVRHKIETGDYLPIKQRPRRLPLAKQAEVENLIQDMADRSVIEPSTSPWSSPVVLVTKKDGSTRFCVDYRRLNEVTKKDSYPLPRIDDTIDTLANAKWFSTLDLKSGYWQVEMDQRDKEKTAFSTGNGLWHFNVMPFGLCNAPATFERLMETVLRGLTWKTCLVYLDDIIIMGKTFEEHLQNVEEIFKKFRGANLKLNPKKCSFFQEEVEYLGHVISSKGVKTDPKKTEAVKNWPVPKDKHELRSFLGLCSYYRRFVRGFADIARPLHKLTENNQPFEWTTTCQEAMEELKVTLCSPPVLAFPRPGEEFIVDADASNIGLGGVLSQIQDGEERVIAYFSKSLSKPERNYCVTRKELLAVVKTVEQFHKYLYGQRFRLRTDHASLKWLFQFKNPEGQIARWLQRLQEYDFQIEHRKGRLHGNADAVSRRPCVEGCNHCKRLEIAEFGKPCRRIALKNDIAWDRENLAADQREDPDLGQIINWKERGERPNWEEISAKSPTLKGYWALWESLIIDGDLLKRKWESPDGKEERLQVVLPRNRVSDVLKEAHNGIGGGHFGINKTLNKVRERFYWLQSRSDVEDWCRRCADCFSSKGPKTRSRGCMKQYNVGAPFERIAVDVAGPFPKTNSGNRYVLVAMDYFSKWPEVYAIPNQEAATVAEVLVDNFFCRFGVPRELHSDQGRNFESAVFTEVCDRLGIKKTRTTPLHPQSDGMVERFNRTLDNYLRTVVDNNQTDWDQHIPLFLMAYRSAVHDSTGKTPASVVFGRELRLPMDLLFGRPEEPPASCDSYSEKLAQRLHVIHEEVRQKLKFASDRLKTRYDKRANSSGFQAGDQVWLYNPARKKGKSPKLQRSWEGPYDVIKRLNDVVYRIQRGHRAKMKIVHLDRLAPYRPPKAGEVDDRDDQL
nr:MAG: replicase [Ips erranti-like virus 3]